LCRRCHLADASHQDVVDRFGPPARRLGLLARRLCLLSARLGLRCGLGACGGPGMDAEERADDGADNRPAAVITPAASATLG
jgi:hypothetical protein